jgi:hypothetical protein
VSRPTVHAVMEQLQALLAVPRSAEHFSTVTPITCADGLQVSVQASRDHYCSPRNDTGPWTHVEVGFPTRRVHMLKPYAEDASGVVYPWTPIAIIAEVIARAGGIVEGGQ